MARLLREGVKTGVFKELNIKIAAALILSSIRWLYDSYADAKSTMNPIELERQIVGLVFDGVIK